MLKFRFIEACNGGYKNEAKRLYEKNPAILNQHLKPDGWTGLMFSLRNQNHAVSRWLLGRPSIDTALTAAGGITALHVACGYGTPLDIVAQLAELSRRQGSLDIKHDSRRTGLDIAVMRGHTSIALHLAWLGAGCRVENKLWPEGVTLQTWLDAGLAQVCLF